MVKINKRLLPIKAHFLFFMGAMGPILPQLSVLGKQIGIAPDIMGYITSVLPIMYVIAKPLFGFIADYFTNFRKMTFILLIASMTFSYAAFYFIPTPRDHLIQMDEVWNISFNTADVQLCSEELVTSSSLCLNARQAVCSNDRVAFQASVIDISAHSPSSGLSELSSNLYYPKHMHLCLPAAVPLAWSTSELAVNVTCEFPLHSQPDCIYGTSTFWLFVTLMCIGTIGFNVTNSISDAICFDVLGETQESKYGAQRVWGTIGFGMTALLGGIVVDMWTIETVKSFTPAIVIMLFFSGLDILSVSKLKLPKLSSSESIFKDVWDLVRHPAIAIFLVFATIAGIIDSFIIYFMFWHVEEVAAQTGHMDQIKLIEGCVVAAECLAGEVPFFFYSGKIIKKIGYVHCMSMCFFFYAIRLGLIAWIPNPWYLVAVELFLQGATYALCYTCIVAYASAVAPPGTSATVQGLMAGMDDGLGFSIGSLVGGLTFKTYGGRRSFTYFAIVAFITCLAHIFIRPTSRKKQYLPKAGYKVPLDQATVTIGTTEKEEVKL